MLSLIARYNICFLLHLYYIIFLDIKNLIIIGKWKQTIFSTSIFKLSEFFLPRLVYSPTLFCHPNVYYFFVFDSYLRINLILKLMMPFNSTSTEEVVSFFHIQI